MSQQQVGLEYQVKIQATNVVGLTESDSVAFLLADVPVKPSAPTRISDGTYLTVVMAPPTSNGGALITNY